MAKYDTRTQQFGLVSGIRQTSSDMVLAAEPASIFAPEARKGRLYIVAETGPEAVRSRDACQTIIRTIRKVFYEDNSYSVTSSLRKAVSAANKALYQHNFNTSAQKRAVVGVTCAVLKDHDLYLAQIAPSQAYLSVGGKLRALPPSPSWSGGQEGSNALLKPGSLGSSLSIEAEFYRATLGVGDTLLVCSTSMARLLGRDELGQLLRSTNPAEVADELLEICKRGSIPEAQGLVLCLAPQLSAAAQATPLSRSGMSERGRLLLRAAGDAVGRVTGEVALLARGKGDGGQQRRADRRLEQAEREQAQLTTMPEEPPAPPREDLRVRPLELGEPLDEVLEQRRQARRPVIGAPPPREPDHELPPSAFLGEGGYGRPPAERRIDLSDTPGMAALGSQQRRAMGVPAIEPTLGERLARPFNQAADHLSGIGRRRRLRRPPPSAMPQMRRRPGLSYRREGAPFPWLLLLLLVLSVSLAVVYGKVLVERNSRQQAEETLVLAEQAVASLREASDATAEDRLAAAAAALARVRSSGVVTSTEEDSRRFAELEREYERAQAAIEKVTYFDDLTEIGQHPQAAALATFNSLVVPPPPQTITNTVGFESIYALDGNAGVLYRIPKAGGAFEPFLSPSDVVKDGQPVGRVRAMAWRLDNIVAVGRAEGEGDFSYYFRSGESWSGSNIGGSTEWVRSDATRLRLVTYDGNLYFWGALPGQVLKYLSGFTSNVFEPWIRDDGGRNIESALDLAVDGKIYLLQPDGRVLVFALNQLEREIAPPDVKPPLVAPAAFVVTGTDSESGYVFYLDVNNERVIQIDKQTGALVQQIRTRLDGPVRLNQLTALAVDDTNPQVVLYLVNQGKVLRASLPPPPRPFREDDQVQPTVGAEATSAPAP